VIHTSIEKLVVLRATTEELAYLRQIKACVGAIARIPNGALKGHVNRDHLAEAVARLLTEIDCRIGHLSPTGQRSADHNG
jgi:hypothetical protein